VEIFQAGTSMCEDRKNRSEIVELDDDTNLRLPFPHLVSSVSRRWRNVALSSPRLWTTIVFNCNGTTDHEGASLWIQRSGACLLDITISMEFLPRGPESYLQSAMDQIKPHTSRWRQFTLAVGSQAMIQMVVPYLRTASAPHLRDLKITLSDDDFDFWTPTDTTSSVCDRLFTGGAASLTVARLIGAYICTPPLTGLTYLQLGGTSHGTKTITAHCLRDMLTASPFLINLELQSLDIVFPLTNIGDIQIPSLCSLTMNKISSRELDFWKFFSIFSLPKLQTLVLAHMFRFSEPLTDIGLPRHATVTVLRLVNCGLIHVSLAKALYSSFPSIVQLDLIQSSGLILKHPHVRSDGDSAIIWPHLKTITISYPVTYETICDFIDNRNEMGHPLGTVNVWSRIRRQMEVLNLDHMSESKFQYPAGLESAIKDVDHEEWEEEWAEDRLTAQDFDRYDDSD